MFSKHAGALICAFLFSLLACHLAGAAPIHDAVGKGDVKQIAAILAADGTQVNVVDQNGATPLCIALNGTVKNQDKIVRLLISKGADVNAVNAQQQTPTMLAAQSGNLAWLKLCAEKGANLTAKDNKGATLMHYAVAGSNFNFERNTIKVTEWLLTHGGSVTATTNAGCTPLHVLYFDNGEECDDAKFIPTRVIQQMLFSEDMVAIMQHTPWWARMFLDGPIKSVVSAKDEHRQVVLEWLVKHGADVNAVTQQGDTPLLDAASVGSYEGVTFLLKKGARLDAVNVRGETALYLAAPHHNMKLIDFLCKHGADVNLKTKSADTPLHMAAYGFNTDCVKLLLRLKADPAVRDASGQTPLHCAATSNFNKKTIAMLVAAKADINARDNEGNTPLHLAAQGGFVEDVTALCRLGAAVNVKNNQGKTPLEVAEGDEKEQVIKVLKQAATTK